MNYQNEILNERESQHGDYSYTAEFAQDLKRVGGEKAREDMTPVQRESLDQILTKISRILSGDSYLKDHWEDIAGYANLVSERLSDIDTGAPTPVDLENMLLNPLNKPIQYGGGFSDR